MNINLIVSLVKVLHMVVMLVLGAAIASLVATTAVAVVGVMILAVGRLGIRIGSGSTTAAAWRYWSTTIVGARIGPRSSDFLSWWRGSRWILLWLIIVVIITTTSFQKDVLSLSLIHI